MDCYNICFEWAVLFTLILSVVLLVDNYTNTCKLICVTYYALVRYPTATIASKLVLMPLPIYQPVKVFDW